MTQNEQNNIQLENFDEIFVGKPEDIEQTLAKLLPQAENLEDKSIYLQMLSQISLAQAMQRKFDLAHKTLDKAEKLLESGHHLARVRIILERGRCFHQEGHLDKALPLFKESYELSHQHGFDFHTVNAAHMMAIVENKPEAKIKWNTIAIELAEKTKDKRCYSWLGPIHNNLAQNYIETQNYEAALSEFIKCKKYAEERGDSIVIRGAKWGIARSMRGLNLLSEALEIQNSLLGEYERIAQHAELPMELIVVGRGLVYEELAEIYLSLSKKHAELCYQDLSKDPWVPKVMPERLERMRALKNYEN